MTLLDASEALASIKTAQLLRKAKTVLKPPRTLRNNEWPPNYDLVNAWRNQQLARFESQPNLLVSAFKYYAKEPVDFINHWCNTLDPRNAGTNKPVLMPFVLFQKQEELVRLVLACLDENENGLVEKSRDMGATWVCVALSVWMWLFWPGTAIGWGSRHQIKVDRIGDPDSIFEKIRILIMSLPKEFLPEGFEEEKHLNFQRCINPANTASITGEVGDNIGRGGRTRVYFKDEASHYEHPEKIEASLSDNTRVQIDISSVNGLGNVFHRKREAGVEWFPGAKLPRGRTRVLVLDWRDHPEKTQDWYDHRRAKAEMDGLQHVLAQEVDRNYSSAVQGTIIPDEWVKAAIDAHVKLKFDDDGMWGAGLDVADQGGDSNALVLRKGPVLKRVDEWGERDTGVTCRRAIAACRDLGDVHIQYDASPIASGVKAEANRLKDDGVMPANVHLVPWLAGGKVMCPQERVVPGDPNSPRNKDFYTNLKAQAWWELRQRFYRTYQAVVEHVEHDPDMLISIDSSLPLLRKLEKELSQPTASQGTRMKLVVDKSPDGTRSPNLADAVVMAYWPQRLNVGQFTDVGIGVKIFVGGRDFNG